MSASKDETDAEIAETPPAVESAVGQTDEMTTDDDSITTQLPVVDIEDTYVNEAHTVLPTDVPAIEITETQAAVSDTEESRETAAFIDSTTGEDLAGINRMRIDQLLGTLEIGPETVTIIPPGGQGIFLIAAYLLLCKSGTFISRGVHSVQVARHILRSSKLHHTSSMQTSSKYRSRNFFSPRLYNFF